MNKKAHWEPNGKFRFKKIDLNAMKIDAAITSEGSDSPNWQECHGSLTDQERKKHQTKGAVSSVEGKAICAVTAKKEMMARAKKLKPAKQTLKKLKNKAK